MFWRHFRNLTVVIRKLLPTIILLVIAILAGATNVFSTHVRELVNTTLKQHLAAFMPMAINLLIVVILLNFVYLLYHPSLCGLERILGKSEASERAKNFTLKAARALYWVGSVCVIVAIFAPEMMGKVVLGFGVLGAAITLALQDAAKNLISGLRIQFSDHALEGTAVKVIGADIEGTVVNIGYFTTVVATEKGEVTVPNTLVWEKAVLKKKPEPSKIILPPGCTLDEPAKKDDDPPPHDPLPTSNWLLQEVTTVLGGGHHK
jgi:small-conductance mechanosensitive channel